MKTIFDNCYAVFNTFIASDLDPPETQVNIQVKLPIYGVQLLGEGSRCSMGCTCDGRRHVVQIQLEDDLCEVFSR